MSETWKLRMMRTLRANGKHVTLTRLVELPFVPANGMQLESVFGPDDFLTIRGLSYHVDDREHLASDEDRLDEDFGVALARSYMDWGVAVDGTRDIDDWAASGPIPRLTSRPTHP